MKTIFGADDIVKKGKILDNDADERKGIVALADLIAASGAVESLKDGDNAVTKILKELTEQLGALEELIAATNYGNKDMGSAVVLGLEVKDGDDPPDRHSHGRYRAVGRGGVTIVNTDLVDDTVASLNINLQPPMMMTIPMITSKLP